MNEKTDNAQKRQVVKAKKLIYIGIPVIVLCAVVSAIIIRITQADKSYSVTTYSMGSYVQQTLYGDGADEAAKGAANEILEFENKISWKVEGSDIQALNMQAGAGFIDIDKNTYQLLSLAKDVYENSGGAFDVTISPISRLWDFDSGQAVVPDKAMIEKFLPNVGADALRLGEQNTAALYSAMNSIDLGGIGKGAACDVAVDVYKRNDIYAGIVAVGGSIGVFGKKNSGETWKIALQSPAGEGSMGEISVYEGFISTSGNYEKFFEQDGVIYHHILDPNTGYPAKSGLSSVTVWSDKGALSDALSTACFVLGIQKSYALLEIYEAEAVFVTQNNEVIVTDGLEDSFKITNSLYKAA